MAGHLSWLAAGLMALPVQAEPAPVAPLDAEFLEFLAATADTDDEFMDYLESPAADRELRRAAAQPKVAKEEKDES